MTPSGYFSVSSCGVRRWFGVVVAVVGLVPASGRAQDKAAMDLPSSKQLGMVPGTPQRLNSLPTSMAVSPDGRYVVTVNAGYGTFESKYEQSLAVLDTRTGKVVDFPDARTGLASKETLFSGLAFSGDGKHVYASLASLTSPAGDNKGNPGNGIAVYGFDAGKITPERLIPIPLQKLAGGRRTALGLGGNSDAAGVASSDLGVPFPAAIAVLRTHANTDVLLVADNLSDDVLLIDAVTGKTTARFDLSESDTVPGTYPVALALARSRTRAYVALWNSSEVVELDLVRRTVERKLALLKPSDPVKPGSHPCALEMSSDGKTLYVALANRDAVAVIDVSGSNPMVGDKTAEHGAPDSVGRFEVKGYFDTRLPGQSYFGAEPDALALSGDGSRLYVADMGSDAVAVIDTKKLTTGAAKEGMVEPVGFIPTEWDPMSMVVTDPAHGVKTAMSGAPAGEKLYVATAKGKGTGPNNFPQKLVPGLPESRRKDFTYIATLLYGSLAAVNVDALDLKAETAEVLQANRMKAAGERIQFAADASAKADSSAALRNDKQGPIKHVLYIIKENRTYDQVFGDLKENGKPVGNGDARLAMYGVSVTPNQHALALQFGVLDNFFDSGEVSGDGHVWSNAAIGTDYLERVWQVELPQQPADV